MLRSKSTAVEPRITRAPELVKEHENDNAEAPKLSQNNHGYYLRTGFWVRGLGFQLLVTQNPVY